VETEKAQDARLRETLALESQVFVSRRWRSCKLHDGVATTPKIGRERRWYIYQSAVSAIYNRCVRSRHGYKVTSYIHMFANGGTRPKCMEKVERQNEYQKWERKFSVMRDFASFTLVGKK
jgi:hypothetical protein